MKNIDKVIELYQKGNAVTTISNILGMGKSNVSFYLTKFFGKNRPKDRRLPSYRRKYTINENCFSIIDSEEKAYFLGLLSADGCISSTSNTIQISLQERDKYILEKLNILLNSNRPLRYIPSTEVKGFDNFKVYYRKPQYLLSVNSQKLKEDLIQLGVFPAKSLTLKFPTCINSLFLHHYVRGYFDGDGGVYSYKNNKWEISIAGNKEFCLEMNKYLAMNNIKSTCKKHQKNNIFYVRLAGRLNCIDFYNLVYNNSFIYLTRKYKKFKECINSTTSIRNGNTWKKERRVNN